MGRLLAFIVVVLCINSARAEVLSEDVVVLVNGRVLALDQYAYEVNDAVRNEFYHGAIPEAQLKSYRREVLESIIDEMLQEGEAVKRGLMFDQAELDEQVDQVDRKNGQDSQWVDAREKWLPIIRAQMERRAIVAELKDAEAELEPSLEQQQIYYRDNPDKFTRPMQQAVSIILLGVDPSSGSTAWEAAEAKAKELLLELEGGAEFEQLAELYSTDMTAPAGGDMGLMHEGMLGEEAQKVIDGLQVGEVSEPVMVLEGVALFRLNQRVEAQLLPFDVVQERLVGLLKRDMADIAWQALTFRLRSQAEVVYNESLLSRLGM